LPFCDNTLCFFFSLSPRTPRMGIAGAKVHPLTRMRLVSRFFALIPNPTRPPLVPSRTGDKGRLIRATKHARSYQQSSSSFHRADMKSATYCSGRRCVLRQCKNKKRCTCAFGRAPVNREPADPFRPIQSIPVQSIRPSNVLMGSNPIQGSGDSQKKGLAGQHHPAR